jgi:acetyl-CoA acetyltransferase family protein
MSQRYQAVGGLVPQGLAAEAIAEQWNLSRDELDTYSVESHRRAAAAAAEGRFEREIVPVVVNTDRGKREFRADDGIRTETSIEALARLQPSFTTGGRITAGNSCQISDGAAAVLVMSEERAARMGLTPRARLVSFAVAGVDPLLMLTGAVPATERALEGAALGVDDLDVIEVNEAFAAVVLAWASDVKADPAKVNVNGGAVALGHPLGASGVRMTATLLSELERVGGRFGLQTMCEGGGMANAAVIERLG